MKPGREMDRLVAKEIMGWEFAEDTYGGLHRCKNCGGSACYDTRLAIRDIYNVWIPHCDGKRCHYSTEDNSAWLVLRAMLEKEIDVDIDRATPPQVSVTFWPSGCYDYAVSGEAETFAEAVCVAALRAMGVTLEAGNETRT